MRWKKAHRNGRPRKKRLFRATLTRVKLELGAIFRKQAEEHDREMYAKIAKSMQTNQDRWAIYAADHDRANFGAIGPYYRLPNE